MIPLFKTTAPTFSGVIVPPQWPYIKAGFSRNAERIIAHRRLYPTAIPNQHLLIRLLHSIAVPMSLPLERYFSNVDAKALALGMSFGMTSVISKGHSHSGVFYGTNSCEYLLALDDYFDYTKTHEQWQDARPITVLTHPKSDLSLAIPGPSNYSEETGLSVVSINIALLAVQYRAFILDQVSRNPEQQLGAAEFLGRYVLPNMLPAQTDLAILNRLMLRSQGMLLGTTQPTIHSFSVTDYTNHLDYTLDKVLVNIDKTSKFFSMMLATIPAVFSENMQKVLTLPDVAGTTQVDWLLLVSRLKQLAFLSQRAGKQLGSSNQKTLNDLDMAYRRNNVTAMIAQMLPTTILENMAQYRKQLSL